MIDDLTGDKLEIKGKNRYRQCLYTLVTRGVVL